MAIRKRIPGIISIGFLMIAAIFWVYWGIAEMYHEGWWGAWTNRVVYLIPGTISISLAVIALYKPGFGAWVVTFAGILISGFFFGDDLLSGDVSLSRLPYYIFTGGGFVLFGLLLFLEERYRKEQLTRGWTPPATWWKRNLWGILLVSLSFLVTLVLSIINLPTVLTRLDDGYRGSTLIETGGEDLIWAPEGYGWNWKQDWGGYPSWNALAQFGKDPKGLEDKSRIFANQSDMDDLNLCIYLNEPGITLLDEPQHIWRMPSTAELVSALVSDGENAGCDWDGKIGRQDCIVKPDKETPLWAPDLAPIYYWSGDEYNQDEAFYVSYNGYVQRTVKSGGNPRHGYRCVREP